MTTTSEPQTRNGAYVDAGEVHTYYEVTGSGDPLILLHGGMCTAETSDAQAHALAERFRVYVPERRGHGRTPDVEGPITYSIMADDTIAFMEAVGLESAHLVGWSDGAMVALLLALRRPELVRRLVLIGQFANLDGAVAAARDALGSLTPEMLPPFLKQLYVAVSPHDSDHFDIVFERLAEAWRGGDYVELDELARVASATLLLLADDDIVTVEHAAEMMRAIPDAQLAVVPGATHALPMEKPDVTNRLLLDFLGADVTAQQDGPAVP